MIFTFFLHLKISWVVYLSLVSLVLPYFFGNKMAACLHAAAPLCPNWMVFSFFWVPKQCICSFSLHLLIYRHTYSCEFLLNIQRAIFTVIDPAVTKELRDCGLLQRPAQPPSPTPAFSPHRGAYKAPIPAPHRSLWPHNSYANASIETTG